MTIRLGTLGLGSTGHHHVRNARTTEGAELVALADSTGDRFGAALPLEVLLSVKGLIAAGIDAAIMVVPTAFHEGTALLLAEAGVHTFAEEPLSVSAELRCRIVEAFERADLVGAIGYVEHYSPALVEMCRRVAQGQLDEIYQIVTRRQSPFPARISDVSVVKGLATHDAGLTSWVVDAPYKVMFTQAGYRSGRVHGGLLPASGRFTNRILANHQADWLIPYKDRTTIIIGEYGALIAGMTMGDLSFCENGSSPLQWEQIAALRGVFRGTVIRYALDKCEPPVVEHEHLRDVIFGRGGEYVSMAEGVRTPEALESILESARTGQIARFSE